MRILPPPLDLSSLVPKLYSVRKAPRDLIQTQISTPTVSDSEVRAGSEFCISNTLQVMLVLLVLDHTLSILEFYSAFANQKVSSFLISETFGES